MSRLPLLLLVELFLENYLFAPILSCLRTGLDKHYLPYLLHILVPYPLEHRGEFDLVLKHPIRVLYLPDYFSG